MFLVFVDYLFLILLAIVVVVVVVIYNRKSITTFFHHLTHDRTLEARHGNSERAVTGVRASAPHLPFCDVVPPVKSSDSLIAAETMLAPSEEGTRNVG